MSERNVANMCCRTVALWLRCMARNKTCNTALQMLCPVSQLMHVWKLIIIKTVNTDFTTKTIFSLSLSLSYASVTYFLNGVGR